MAAVVVLVLLGILLLFVDLFFPTFGIAILLGGGMIVWGQVLAFRIGVGVGATTIAATLALTAASLWFGWRLAMRLSIIHTAAVGNDPAAEEFRQRVMGAVGTACTMLRPAGKVRIGDQTYDARSPDAVVEAGAQVRVVAARNRELLVRPISHNEAAASERNG
jgi:membrane-bound serine protease (ClpP class)